MEHWLMYYLAGVPLLGITAQWLAWRLRLPSILLLLTFGVLLGMFLPPDEVFQKAMGESLLNADHILFPVVSLSVAVILLEGGLTLRLKELKESGGVVLRLCTIGALVSWVLTAVAAHYILGFAVPIATLIGAILVVTGPTVIAPLLRHIQPSRRIGSIVKWEGIVIDPIGAVLAVLVFDVITSHHEASAAMIVWSLAKTILIGGAAGLITGLVLATSIRRFWIPDFLQGALVLTVALASFVVSNHMQSESGLVTVTVLGVYLANQKGVSLEHVAEFKEHLVVLLIASLFIVLGSRVELAQVWALGLPALAFVGVMIVVVRPLAVLAASIGSTINWRERAFLSFLAPRGIVAAAVASIFAIEAASHLSQPILKEQASQMAPVAFVVIFGTVLVYGLLAGPVARLLGLADPNPQGVLIAGAGPLARSIGKALHENDVLVMLVDTNFRHVTAARMEGMKAVCASILSEHAAEDLDLGGIGRLMAITPNDTVNALAVRVFKHHFGRQNVLQLASVEGGAGPREAVGHHLKGRILFEEGLTFERLTGLLGAQATSQIKTTPLSESFTYEDYRERYTDAIELFALNEAGVLRIVATDEEFEPQENESIVSIIPKQTAAPVIEEEPEATE